MFAVSAFCSGSARVPGITALAVGTLPAEILLAQQREASGSPVAAVQSAPNASGQAGVIKVEAPSVLVDVIVTDKKGRHASDFTPSDFAGQRRSAEDRNVCPACARRRQRAAPAREIPTPHARPIWPPPQLRSLAAKVVQLKIRRGSHRK